MTGKATFAFNLVNMTLLLFVAGCSLASDTIACGRFPLMVTVETPSTGQSLDLTYAVFWNSAFAEYVMMQGDSAEMEFQPLEDASKESPVIYVPFSSRTGPFGGERSYSQAKFLVIEYSTTIEGRVVRKRGQLDIPDGRRKRDLLLALKSH